MKKIRPYTVPKDFCQTSFDQIQNFVNEWFQKYVPDAGEIWIPDDEKYNLQENYPQNNNAHIEVVLTGKFFLRFLEMPCWPWDKIRVWVLSQRIKDVLVNLCGFPPLQIGVIPREQLVPNLAQQSKELSRDQINFVYAGRLSAGKNIEGLLQTISMLQKTTDKNVTLDIFGEYDDMLDDSWGRFANFSYKDKLQKTLQSLSWKNPPIFHGWVPTEQWLAINRPAPVFVSLSTFMSEDFGIAARFAQRVGWPCFLSDWGGHADQKGINQFLIPHYLIPQTYDSEFVSVEKSKALAKWIHEHKHTANHDSQNLCEMPLMTIKNQIFLYHKEFIKKWQPKIFYAIRNNLALFADSREGTNFFIRYRALMGSSMLAHELVIVSEDLDYNVLPKGLNLGENCEVLPARYIFSNYFITNINRYDHVRIEAQPQHITKLTEFLSGIYDMR